MKEREGDLQPDFRGTGSVTPNRNGALSKFFLWNFVLNDVLGVAILGTVFLDTGRGNVEGPPDVWWVSVRVLFLYWLGSFSLSLFLSLCLFLSISLSILLSRFLSSLGLFVPQPFSGTLLYTLIARFCIFASDSVLAVYIVLVQ